MNHKKYLWSILSVLFLAACTHTPSKVDVPTTTKLDTVETTQSEPINIAFNTWIGYSSFYVAQDEGIFEKYGLTVNTEIIDSLAEKNAAVLRGDLDGMGGTLDSSIISKSSGVDGNIVYLFDRSNGTDGILVSEDIQSVQDLKGKRIAVEEGFVGHFFLLYVLHQAGLSHEDITIVPMATDQAGTAFLAGKVDAAVTWEPLLSQALEREGSSILVSSAAIDPILVDVLYMSEQFLSQRPEDAKKLVAALNEANELWNNNQTKYLPLLDTYRGWGEDELAATMTTVELYDGQSQQALLGDSNSLFYDMFDTAAKLWYEAGIVKTKLGASDIIDASFIPTQ